MGSAFRASLISTSLSTDAFDLEPDRSFVVLIEVLAERFFCVVGEGKERPASRCDPVDLGVAAGTYRDQVLVVRPDGADYFEPIRALASFFYLADDLDANSLPKTDAFDLIFAPSRWRTRDRGILPALCLIYVEPISAAFDDFNAGLFLIGGELYGSRRRGRYAQWNAS